MQQKEITNPRSLSAPEPFGDGPIVALDPGTKRIGVAVSDKHRIIARPLPAISRSNWKQLLADVRSVTGEFDAAALVIGLPLNTDGSDGDMSVLAREMARKFAISLSIPVYLQDERVTTYEARKRLWERGVKIEETGPLVDSEAAAVILGDFLDRLENGSVGPSISVQAE